MTLMSSLDCHVRSWLSELVMTNMLVLLVYDLYVLLLPLCQVMTVMFNLKVISDHDCQFQTCLSYLAITVISSCDRFLLSWPSHHVWPWPSCLAMTVMSGHDPFFCLWPIFSRLKLLLTFINKLTKYMTDMSSQNRHVKALLSCSVVTFVSSQYHNWQSLNV